MASGQGIKILLVGRSAANGKTLIPMLQPDIDVVHFCETTAIARDEIPPVLEGKVFTPKSAIGSNARRGGHPLKPQTLLVGAGFPDEDYLALRNEIGEGHGLPWARERKTDVEGLDKEENWTTEFGPRLPKAEVLARSVERVVRGTMRGDPEYTSR